MSGWFKLTLRVGIFAVGISAASCFAAGSLLSVNTEEDTHEKSWNREHRDDSKQDARAIVKKKAMARAEQRNEEPVAPGGFEAEKADPRGAAGAF